MFTEGENALDANEPEMSLKNYFYPVPEKVKITVIPDLPIIRHCPTNHRCIQVLCLRCSSRPRLGKRTDTRRLSSSSVAGRERQKDHIDRRRVVSCVLAVHTVCLCNL